LLLLGSHCGTTCSSAVVVLVFMAEVKILVQGYTNADFIILGHGYMFKVKK